MSYDREDRTEIDPEALAVYRESFAATCAAAVQAGATPIDDPGISGFVATGDGRSALLITDDAARARLPELLAQVRLAAVRVLPTAPDCLALLDGDASWPVRERTTAMLRRDLASLEAPPMPDGLTIEPIARPPHQLEGVGVRDAAVAAIAADPLVPPDPDAVAEQLLKLPPRTQLFAAVDGDGTIRGTAASGYAGDFVAISFVTTDHDWRRRGVAVAMTAHALRAAHEHGPSVASLEATDAGYSVYRRLGFAVIGPVHCFARIV